MKIKPYKITKEDEEFVEIQAIVDMNDGTYVIGKVSGRKVVLFPIAKWDLVQRAGNNILNVKGFEDVSWAPVRSAN